MNDDGCLDLLFEQEGCVILSQMLGLIRKREFGPVEARTLIKTSYYFGGAHPGDKHPDVHIALSKYRPVDYHIVHVSRYDERGSPPHTMFRSMDHAI